MATTGDCYDSSAAIIVAAIDFGTTYSGYGFSFKNKPNNVMVNKNWGDEVGTSSFKTPTCVLIDSNKKFVSFGYTAEHDYSQFCATGKGEDYDLFRHFKMMLYKNKKLSRTTKMKSTRGTEHAAAEIFTMALKFLKDHLLEAVNKQTSGTPKEGDIKWVLTIPAIWSDKAKQFMREAALEAGLIRTKDSKQLQFALEPEAASVFCRNLQVNQFTDDTKETLEFHSGTKYMIIDAGGGTIDITAHEIQADGNMIELMCASGGDWGGNQVNKHFEDYMAEILGQDFIDVYKRDCPSQWLALINEFERKKRAANIGKNAIISVTLAWSMVDKFKEIAGKDIQMVLQSNSSKGYVFNQGNIVISAEIVRGFFNPILDNIVNHIRETLLNDNLQNLGYMLLVGGFSESRFLFERIKQEFSSECTVISPQSASLSIIQGAVMFGHKPQVITARRARKTYGQSIKNEFIEGKHDPQKMYINELGEKLCLSSFIAFVTKDELIYFNSSRKFYTSPSQFGKTIKTIYSTERKDVIYSDEPGVKRLGTLELDFPTIPGKSLKDIYIETRVYFGQTEIEIEAQNMSIEDGEIAKTSIDFLED